MQGSLNNLDGRVVAHIGLVASGQRNLWQAERTAVVEVRWPRELEHRVHRVRHVLRLGANAEVDVDECREMAIEPTRLEGNRASVDGPLRSIAVVVSG